MTRRPVNSVEIGYLQTSGPIAIYAGMQRATMSSEVTCKYCGKTTPARYGNGLARHYCGKECSELHRNKLRRERRAVARPSHEATLAGLQQYMAARRARLAQDQKRRTR